MDVEMVNFNEDTAAGRRKIEQLYFDCSDELDEFRNKSFFEKSEAHNTSDLFEDLLNLSGVNIIGVYSEGEAIGFAVVDVDNENQNDRSFFVQDLYVAPDFRNLGVGRQIVSFIEDEFDDGNGAAMFILEENEVAQSFWSSVMPDLGFEEIFGEDNVIIPEGCIFKQFVTL